MARFGRTDTGSGPAMSDMTVGDYANGMPHIRVGSLLRSLLKSLIWIIPLLILGGFVANLLTKDIKQTYEAYASVMVQAGPEYFYQSDTNQQQGQSVLLTPDTIALNEAAIMKNDRIISTVAEYITGKFPGKLAPEIENKINNAHGSGDQHAKNEALVELHKFLERNYVVMPRPKTGVIDLVFKHEDPAMAKEVVNTFLDEYKIKRGEFFTEGTTDKFAGRLSEAQEQLDDVNGSIQSFLRKNGISDYDSERSGATRRTEDLRAQLNTIQSQMTETEAALASVETQLRSVPAEINLYVDDRGAQRVAQAELELKQLLAKYLPGSNPVRAKETEIAELKSLQRANGGNAIGGRRVGPNPTYQALLTRRNTLQSTADSYREKEFTLQRQLNSADAKVQKLQKLMPAYNALLRKQSTLDLRLKGLNSKEQEALINKAQMDAENIRVISEAQLPRKGRNMSKVIFALMMLGWLFTLLMAALLTAFLNPKNYDPGRRMRPRQPDYGFAGAGGIGGGTEYQPAPPPSQPYTPIPEPVPMQPAAAQAVPAHSPEIYDPAATYAPSPQTPPQPYEAVPYTGATAQAYDYNANPYNPEPVIPQGYEPGILPGSETE